MAADDRMVFWSSPDGARTVEVVWIEQGAGLLGRDRRVPRLKATNARITEWGGSAEGERMVTVFEANAYVKVLEELRDRQAEEAERQSSRRGEVIATITSTCPHCRIARLYSGLERLQEGGILGVAILGEGWAGSNVDVHVYVCQSCGSLEFFSDGILRHPVPGNAAIEPINT
jgi:hypothetical protein